VSDSETVALSTVVLQFVCDAKELHVVKKNLVEAGLETGAARLEYIPHLFSLLDSAGLDAAVDMREALEQLDDVVRVFDNIRPMDPDTWLALGLMSVNDYLCWRAGS